MQNDDVLHALARAKDAVVAGNFVELASFRSVLESAQVVLDPATDKATANLLKMEAERLQQCLAAALQGMRAAQSRLADVMASQHGLNTYDQGGRKAPIGGATSGVVHRL
jgi:hypothetical protein